MRLGSYGIFLAEGSRASAGAPWAVTFTTRSFVDPVARVLLARLARADPSIPDRESLRASSVAECLHCWGPGSKDSDSDRMGGR